MLIKKQFKVKRKSLKHFYMKFQDIRRKKDNYRNQMLIEKAIGIYDADGLKSKLDEINCHYCGEIITRSAYEPGRYNS